MKRTTWVLAGTLLAAACEAPPPSAPSPATQPLAVDGGSVSALNTPPTGVFRYRPAARQGVAPFDFEVNMCKTVDPDLDDDLRFVVSWGDGTEDRGSCHLDHVYRRSGLYQGRACVSDRVRGSAESCEDFEVEVVRGALVPFLTRKTINDTLDQLGAGGPGLRTTSIRLLGTISGDDLRSAQRIVVEWGTLVATNNMPDVRLGLGVGLTYTQGSPNLAGQSGIITVELEPAQFAGVVFITDVVLTYLPPAVGTGSIFVQPRSPSATVTLYRYPEE
jgi:hypothetical protein